MTAHRVELAYSVTAKERDSIRTALNSALNKKSWVVKIACLFLLSPWLLLRNLLLAIEYILARLAHAPHRNSPPHDSGEGVNWGDQKIKSGPDGLTVRFSARTTAYRWAAIRELRKTRTMILLMLTSIHAIPIPRRAFASAAEEERFCDFVHERIAKAIGANAP